MLPSARPHAPPCAPPSRARRPFLLNVTPRQALQPSAPELPRWAKMVHADKAHAEEHGENWNVMQV